MSALASVPPQPAADDVVDVSIVLPVFNEAGHLEAELDRIDEGLRTDHRRYEIIVVDDGSTDGSADVAAGRPGVRLIRLGANRGSGTARRIGTQAARGEVVVWTDADLTYPNDRIPELVDALDGADQVVGARDRERGTARAVRVPAKYLIRRLAQYLARTPIPDLNSGFRAFRRDVAGQFLSQLPSGFSCVTTMTMSFLSNGYDVRYLPITYEERAGRSKFHWWRDTSRYLLQVVRMVLSYDPLRVFMPPGLLMLLVGTGKLVYDAVARDLWVASNTIILLVMATQLIAVGLLADLVVRVSRPPDLVAPAASQFEEAA